jgi:alpha-glucosidase
MQIRLAASTLMLSVLPLAAAGQTVETVSPNGANRIVVTLGEKGPTYTVSRKRQALIAPSPLGLVMQDETPHGRPLGTGLTLTAHTTVNGEEAFTLPVGKASKVRSPYRQTELTFSAKEGPVKTFKVLVRAYDDGVALRYVIPQQAGAGALTVQDEATAFRFAADYQCWGLNQGRYENSFEGEHDPVKGSGFRIFHLYQSPLVCKAPGAAFAIAESDPQDFPGAYFTGLGEGTNGVRVTLTPRKDNDPEARARIAAAQIDPARGVQTPWRVIMLADSAGKLIESNLINALATPSKVADTSWIKPGLSAWDWWNGNQFALPAPHNAGGQTSGMNTATYMAYVDFAAELGLEYIMIDEGWSVGSTIEPNPQADVTRPKPEMDIAAIARYAQSKNVGVWLWLQWKQLDNQLDAALATYQQWGVKGIKVDFINRNDQQIMPFYHRLLSKAAQHQLMVNLHGAFPPAGLARTYPNYMTQEGVLGAENNKWSQRITARHNIMLAYTRGLLGPMDYTPGGFRHVTPREFPAHQSFINPVVMTTRGAALAMYVVYESPLGMVSDSPPAYRKADGSWEDGVDFLKLVPASWDETRFIAGDIGDYVAIARRSGQDWYIGAMTDQARTVELPLDFLGAGAFRARSWQDGASVSTLRVAEQAVARGQRLKLKLAANGGAAVIVSPAK